MEEIWEDVIIEKNGVIYDYTGYYQVSNMGRVKRIGKTKCLKRATNKFGYLYVDLYKNGEKEKFFVHRLTATAFIPNPNNLPCVNHKNENKTDCRVENLEWCTVEYNNSYGTRLERLSESRKGKYVGIENGFYGKTHTDEVKKKISKTHKGKSKSKEHMNKLHQSNMKKVICLETHEVFDSVKLAVEWCHGQSSDISKCCNGKAKSAGKHPITGEKLRWMYYDEYLKLDENSDSNVA